MFKKYPFIKQSESKDCGVSCMEMIFKYYNGYVSKLKLQEMTKTTKSGTSAYHMIETFKYFGFTAKGIKCEIADLDRNILPLIAHVTIDDTFYHYIVIYEVNLRKNYLLIADPNDKIKKISLQDFEKIYNNVIITMSPTKKLPSYVGTHSKIEFCMKIISNYKGLFIKTLILSIFITIFSIINSFYLKYMIDYLVKDTLTFLFILFSHFYLFNLFATYFRNKLLIIIKQYIDYDMTTLTFKQIINLPYRYFASRTTGDIVSRISDLEHVKEVLSKVILTLFVDIILVIFSFISLYFINIKLFFISIIGVFFYFVILILYRKLIRNQINLCQKEKANITSYMIENISNYETVKGLHIEKNIHQHFSHIYVEYLKKILKIENIYNSQNLLKNLVNDLLFLVIIYIGCLEVINGRITVGGLLAFHSLVIYFLNPIKEMIDLDHNINYATSALDRVFELYFNESEHGIFNNNIDGEIKITNLNYSYNDREPILENINLEIKKAEKVLILGDSGSGKSTILKLIKKYYKVGRNQIIIDKKDINDYTSETINHNICYVSQNENLYTDTIYNNIVVNRKLDMEKVEEISKLCYIDFFDQQLGFQTLIEENGFNISGGQRQRIILARSLLNRSNIFLIDEATNEMDHNLERKILKNIFSKFSNKTIIMISHRIENIDLFDKVIRLKHGKLEEVIIKNG